MTAEERRRLAAVLRALREDAGLSTTQLAARLGVSQSKVSKTERGRTLPQPDDVDAWGRATGAPPEVRAELVALAEGLSTQFTELRRALAPGRRRKQEEIRRLEAAVSVIRVFDPNVIVGLAQTPRYAEAMFRLGRDVGRDDDLGEIVEARLARQAALRDEGRQFSLLTTETALRRRLVPSGVMRAQIERLIELSAQDNVRVGVIRFDADERVHQYHGFEILGDPAVDTEALVLVETVTHALTVRKTEEIRDYIDHFEALWTAAVGGEALREFLRDVAPP